MREVERVVGPPEDMTAAHQGSCRDQCEVSAALLGDHPADMQTAVPIEQ